MGVATAHSSGLLDSPAAFPNRGADAADRARSRARVMNRRTFLCGLTLGRCLRRKWARRSKQARSRGSASCGLVPPLLTLAGSTRCGLRELGYVEGKNTVIEYRYAETADQLSQQAAELVRLDVTSSSPLLQLR
jgi:hypothetical protein